MREKGLLYFALGVTTVLSLGAVTNQVSGGPSGVALSDTGITFPDGTLQTTAASADPRRAFYLTDAPVAANATLTACAAGFHMASIWEILDVSNLRYATDTEGNNDVFRAQDSGVGPSENVFGWIRTGGPSFVANVIGLSNCSAWTSNLDADFGSVVELERTWEVSAGLLDPWSALTCDCAEVFPVWCVED